MIQCISEATCENASLSVHRLPLTSSLTLNNLYSELCGEEFINKEDIFFFNFKKEIIKELPPPNKIT